MRRYYQTDAFAKRIGKGRENVYGRNEPFVQPVIVPSSRWIKLIGLEHGENGGGRIACFDLFEEVVVLKIVLRFFLVRL
jgi:hypothetical protein